MKKNREKKENLNRQIAGVMILLVVGTIFLCWLLNTCFLGAFYIQNKQKNMLQAYHTMNRLAREDNVYSQQSSLELERLAANDGISVMIIASDGSILISSAGRSQEMVEQLLTAVLTDGRQEGDVLESEDSYVIEKQTDSRMQEEYLVLWGVLDDGNMIMIRSAVEGIRESAALSNRFLIYVGLIAVLVAIIIAGRLSEYITSPLQRLTDISRRMAELDFDAKYLPQKKRNEIDLLGERMNEMSATLEHTIRDLKQANLELMQGMEQKEKNEEMRTEFISSVSHELKTPIALILGYGEGLQEGIAEDEESRKFYYDVIVDEAKKMERMVHELLALNQLESGGRHLQMEWFSLTDMIRGILSASSILMDQQQITAQLIAEEPVSIWADEFFTEQVVRNFISNAIHYAANEKQIVVRCDPTENGNIRLGVFNTGNAIPEEELPHIWEKFYKGDKARTREYGGSGIGLSVVKAVMESFQKPYGVKNYDNGVEFWCEFDHSYKKS